MTEEKKNKEERKIRESKIGDGKKRKVVNEGRGGKAEKRQVKVGKSEITEI